MLPWQHLQFAVPLLHVSLLYHVLSCCCREVILGWQEQRESAIFSGKDKMKTKINEYRFHNCTMVHYASIPIVFVIQCICLNPQNIIDKQITKCNNLKGRVGQRQKSRAKTRKGRECEVEDRQDHKERNQRIKHRIL